MRKIPLFVYNFFCFALLLGIFTGCNLNPMGADSDNNVVPVTPANTGANVRFAVKLPSSPNLVSAIRGASSGDTKVSFKLSILDANASGPIVLKKVVVASQTSGANTFEATVEFNNLPKLSTIGEVSIENGNIGGSTALHGALDLIAGSNTMNISPVGSGLEADQLAKLAKEFIKTPANIAKIKDGFINQVKQVIGNSNIDFTDTTSISNAISALATNLDKIPDLLEWFGIAVDPYIEGTKFFYDENGNGIYDNGEPVSSPTDANGNFSIQARISEEYDLLTLPGNFGKHLGKDFPFQMRSGLNFKDTNGKIIVSPITSVVSWGIDVSKLLQTINTEFAAAGITETIAEADIKGDPLAGLDQMNAENLTNNDLRKIRAVIAVQQYIATLKKIANSTAASYSYQITNADLDNNDNKKLLRGIAMIVQKGCNVDFIRSSTTTINDAVNAAAQQISAQLALIPGAPSFGDTEKNKIRNALQVKAIDVAKTCVSIAEFCSDKIVAQAKANGGTSSLTDAFFTQLVQQTSQTMVPQIGPRYYFQRIKAVFDNPPTITGVTSPVNVDSQIWAGIKNGLQFADPVNNGGNINAGSIEQWGNFKGINIDASGNLSALP